MNTNTEKAQPQSQLRFGLRVLGLIGLMALALSLVDIGQFRSIVQTLSAVTLVSMIAVHVLIILVTSLRFALIARASGAQIKLVEANRLTFSATLANMLLPTSLAGDAGRVWLVRRFGLTLKAAIGAGVFDRVIGLVSLGGIVICGAIAEPTLLPLKTATVIFLLSGVIAAVIALHWRQSGTRAGFQIASDVNLLRVLGVVTALSVVAHLCSVAIAYIFLQQQGTDATVAQLLILFPAVLLAASVPVSVGGWGARELTAAATLSIIGVNKTMAIALAFTFGLTQTLAAALGTFVFVLLAQVDQRID